MIFGFLCIAIFFRIIYTMVSRYFYAHKDTKTPLYVSIFIIFLNIILAYNLSKPTAYGIAGLAMAQSIVAATEVGILVLIMIKRDPHLFDKTFVKQLGRILSVTGFSAIAAYATVKLFPLGYLDQGFILLFNVCLIAGVTFAVHIIVSYMFDLEEAKLVVERIKRIVLRPIKI
jgi:peptidoglycan biosynthesis protein MviN/MurJ (putative lipid II flippase)